MAKQHREPDEQNRQAAPLFHQGERTFYDQDRDEDYRSRAGRGKKAGKKRKKTRGIDILYNIAIALFAVVFLVCAGLLGKRFLDDRQLESNVAELESLIEEEPQDSGSTEEEPLTNAEKFARLVERNSDFIGWITIENTNVNFPVMQSSPDNKDFYLRHNFDREYDDYGVPYLDEDCTLTADARSTNLIIYGHHMKSGTVFGSLTNYKKASYYDEHPTIEFDTLYGDGTYEVFGAFAIDVVTGDFPYNTYIDMDETTFNEFVDQVKQRSDVDSGITPVYGDQLLTLSTCEYSTDPGRYVVCARKIS